MARNGQKQVCFGEKNQLCSQCYHQKRMGEETSQIGFEKMFKPVTSKLDDVMGPGPSASAASNLPDGSLRSHAQKQPARRKKANLEGIDYFPDVDPLKIWMLKVCLTKLFRPS